MTLWAASRGAADRYVIADRLEPIAELWIGVIERTGKNCGRNELVQAKKEHRHEWRIRSNA